MDFQIVWSDPAIENLGEIVRRIAADNPVAALKLGQELVARVETAGHFPRSGPLFSMEDAAEYRCLTHGNYRVYYRLRPDRTLVEVVAVRHSARAQPRF